MWSELVASIPSPEWGRSLRLYGIMIAIGVIAGIELARRRWAARGGDPEDIYSVAFWAVPAGLIGARLYHVITDNQLYRDPQSFLGLRWGAMLQIWQGGLGIPGGIACGVIVGVIVGRKRGMSLPVGLDVIAPSLALAQAIGRWGNYFNQELYGRPSDLPWAVEIDVAHRPLEYLDVATFHATFLYESLWNFALCGALILLDRRRVVRPGRIFALYLGGYFLGRFWVEALRIDSANTILGLRINTWLSLIVMASVGLFLVIAGLKRRPDDRDDPYTDGHVFDPAEAAPEAEPDAARRGRSVPTAVDPAGSATGTKARAERRSARAGGAGPDTDPGAADADDGADPAGDPGPPAGAADEPGSG
jgi:prolipoprotein diacylglyceryl transferase